MRRIPVRAAALLLLAAGACHSSPEHLPPGGGLVNFDREPPPGAETFPAPRWKVGDRFVYRKGGLARLAFRVEETVDGVHRLVDEQSGLVTLVGEDLSERGQEKPGEPELTRVYDPADVTYSWPLWKGKHWSCSYVVRGEDRPDLPLLVSYECDAVEDVQVPAGTFRCLRIWRRARLAMPGEFVDRHSITWYSPEAGAMVRRLTDSLLLEAEEIDRQ